MNLLLRECFQLIKKFHPKIFLGDRIAVIQDQERDEYKRNFSFSNFQTNEYRNVILIEFHAVVSHRIKIFILLLLISPLS
jgi:hypothetical protein